MCVLFKLARAGFIFRSLFKLVMRLVIDGSDLLAGPPCSLGACCVRARAGRPSGHEGPQSAHRPSPLRPPRGHPGWTFPPHGIRWAIWREEKKREREASRQTMLRCCRVKRGCPHAARGVLSGRLLPKSEPRARAGVLLPKPPAPWLASMCFLACLTVLCCPSASGAGGAQWDRRIHSEPDPDSCRRSTFSALLSGTRRGAAPRDSSPPAPPPGLPSPPPSPNAGPGQGALSPSRRLGVFLRIPPEQPPTLCVPTLSGAPHLLPHLFVYICVDL